MTNKHISSLVLLAIFITALAVAAQKFFPERRLVVWPNSTYINYFYAATGADSYPNAYWLDQNRGQWRCTYPEDENRPHLACSFNIQFADTVDRGADLSVYSHLRIKLKYNGNAEKIRVFLRNYDPRYSKINDANSTKFQSVILQKIDLNKEISIGLDEFVVGDWWLGQYNIPRHMARPQMDNISTLGIDFVDGKKTGDQDIEIEKIEFVGGWVAAEDWYLLILGCWMTGLFFFSAANLLYLRRQAKRDGQVINELNKTNAELQQEKDQFRRLSTVDPLTQAYNRFGIDQIVSTLTANETDRSLRHAPDFALVIADIDYFKRINDLRGHDTGDRVLQQVASIINSAIRPQDFLGRWGGEEFVVIMPNTTKEFALAMAEKIRMLISDKTFELGNPLSVTASFGVGEKSPNEDFATAFKRVDTALYEAKAQGRNCCVLAGSNFLR